MSAVLMDCNPFRSDMVRITLAEHRTSQQTARMAQVTEQAAAAWKLERHPGWYAAEMDSQPLLDCLQGLLSQQVGLSSSLFNAGSVSVVFFGNLFSLFVWCLLSMRRDPMLRLNGNEGVFMLCQ